MVLSLRELVNEDWWDDMSPEDQAAYIKKHPGSKQAQSAKDKEEPKTDIFGNVPEDPDVDPYGDDDDDWETHGVGPSFWDSPTPGNEPSHPDDMDDREVFQFLNKDEPEDEGEPYKREPFQPGDDPEELSVGAAQEELEIAQQEMADAEEMGDKAAYADAEEKEYALQVRLGIAGRTGNELNQETLTIDGKQFRRISEGVEKQPKPKYEFSEFYQRFKR